jgi:hypothetical protein
LVLRVPGNPDIWKLHSNSHAIMAIKRFIFQSNISRDEGNNLTNASQTFIFYFVNFEIKNILIFLP